jgi:zinc and cadmium transporter
MKIIYFYSLLSVLIVSLISLIAILPFFFGKKKLQIIILILVSFSAGVLLGDAFLHLLPEAVKDNGFTLKISLYFLSGIMLFFVLEKFIRWHHCHQAISNSHPHPFALMNLVGDGVHNLIDGILIAGSYLVSIPLGIATTIAVIWHEIPQELSDFGVLLAGGFTKKKALFFNFLSACAAILGALLTLAVSSKFINISQVLIPITAGGFVYIAGSDLIPEMHKETSFKVSIFQFIAIVLGIGLMVILKG